MPRLLALPAPASDDDKVAVVLCGIDLRTRRLEPAGHAFHHVHERPVLEAKAGGRKRQAAAREASDDEAEAPAEASWRRKKKEGGEKRSALKLSPQLVGVDLYALLEINESASTEQIKKQYRKLALQHHPDKQSGAKGGEADASAGERRGLSEKDMHFVKIQEAYEVLSDQSKRRQYDSTLDFDDDVPDEADAAAGGFYETFVPVFRRNSRWSVRLPVPELGDEKTDINKVHKFYDFWYNFETWRDFSMHDEYNLEDAEFREERRWMDRQNQKVRKRYQEAERKRVFKLVETAERLDPRIRAEKEEREAKKREEKERRARAKQEEEEARRQQEEERKRREEEERAAREEKERLEREQRKQEKQASKALRQRLKKCVQSKCKLGSAEMEDVQEFCLAMEAGELEALCGRLEAAKGAPAAEALIRDEVSKWQRSRVEEKEQQERQRQEARRLEEQKASEAKGSAAAAAAGAPWTTEELGLLAKGLQKFPGGMGGRWGLITQLMQNSGFPRTEPEVVAKTKELSEGQSLKSMGSRLNTENSFQAPKAKAPAPAPAKAAPAKPAPPGDPPPNGGGGGGEPAPAAAAEWTPEQQKALETALQRHPASLDKNERWRLIAEDVPGKTKAQCVERFKFLRGQLAAGKK
uniref:DnaJ homolog subfamily C member 2 n=1 Tax=Alexandrium monilatum TaxID=311494 RepID=A0A7S4VKN5_9DINO|mmetsp:Transcript_77891/g.246083  ORF Transcript_77891/g.246083 Transcript_77891/m.246083 type:complete len:640 (+) Transcript_77891:21-1940(+)